MFVRQLKDPMELFVKTKEILSSSGFLSRRNMTLLKATLNPFLPSMSSQSSHAFGGEFIK